VVTSEQSSTECACVHACVRTSGIVRHLYVHASPRCIKQHYDETDVVRVPPPDGDVVTVLCSRSLRMTSDRADCDLPRAFWSPKFLRNRSRCQRPVAELVVWWKSSSGRNDGL
jgi:hypothetical protein